MFDILFIIVPILIACGFIFTFAMIFSPKLRGKMMSRQFKSIKYMMDESKDDFADIANSAINIKKNILDNNEDVLTKMVNQEANIIKGGVETTARAIKKGITEDKIYCKHCGSPIDSDSKFCKSCGKEQ